MKIIINTFKTQINNTFNSLNIFNLKNNIFMIKTEVNKQIKIMICLTRKKSKKDMLVRPMQGQDILEEIKKMKIIKKKDKKLNRQIIMMYPRDFNQMKKMDLLSSLSMQVNLIMIL